MNKRNQTLAEELLAAKLVLSDTIFEQSIVQACQPIENWQEQDMIQLRFGR